MLPRFLLQDPERPFPDPIEEPGDQILGAGATTLDDFLGGRLLAAYSSGSELFYAVLWSRVAALLSSAANLIHTFAIAAKVSRAIASGSVCERREHSRARLRYSAGLSSMESPLLPLKTHGWSALVNKFLTSASKGQDRCNQHGQDSDFECAILTGNLSGLPGQARLER